MGVSIRDAEQNEAGALARLQLATALVAYAEIFPREAPAPTVEDLTRAWSTSLGPDDGERGFVAELDGQPVGVVLAGPDRQAPRRGLVSRLYVAPDLWGTGIGVALHGAALDHLTHAGFVDATLWVLERNHRARWWYERLGWTLTDEERTVYEPAGIIDVRYGLPLG